MLGQTPQRTFPPLITAGRWPTVWASSFEAAKRRRNLHAAGFPLITNGDAATLIRAWSLAGPFPLWYQFAGSAFGWAPGTGLRSSTKQRLTTLDTQIARELWEQTKGLADGFESSRRPDPRLELDDNAFNDPVFQGQVLASLKADSGSMRSQGRIPFACKDPRTGESVAPKMKCREGFTLEVVKGTPFYICRNKETGATEQPTIECEDEKRYIEDPITAVSKTIVRLALILGFAYLVVTSLGNDERH